MSVHLCLISFSAFGPYELKLSMYSPFVPGKVLGQMPAGGPEQVHRSSANFNDFLPNVTHKA